MKVLLGIFLIAHGLVHLSYLMPKPDDPNYPFDFGRGWFASFAGSLAKPVGMLLVCAVTLAFTLGGLGVLGVSALENLADLFLIGGSVLSLLVLVLYWHKWLVLGIIINIAIIWGVLLWNN